ncbi:MAG: IclR family transcriptional regulator [Deltaproteobacteria bacterium]|nr:IclR family transcriptional regulator [Deltaproteobacteria bacterium]
MKLSSLDKSLKVITLLSKHQSGLSLTEISKTLAYPISTVHHILSTFLTDDYVTQDPRTKEYSLGFGFLKISKKILDNIDLRKIAHDHLVELSEKVGETIHLYILRKGMVAAVDMIPKKSGLSLASYVGFTADPHPSASGKLLLSGLSNDQVMALYKDRPLKQYGKNTITNMNDLLSELENIRQLGYAIDNEEFYEGIRCVAAPVRGGGSSRIGAAVSITGSIFTMTMERINRELISMAQKTAEKISARMVW